MHDAIRTNEVNASFEVFFPSGPGLANDLIVLFDESTAGYPAFADRTVNIAVTEPNVTLTKETCNESVSIANNAANSGVNCQPFVALPAFTGGDSDDNFIYRITVTNEAAASGRTRAPAYDVAIIDMFDASDQMAPYDFSSDGLDNDGDSVKLMKRRLLAQLMQS